MVTHICVMKTTHVSLMTHISLINDSITRVNSMCPYLQLLPLHPVSSNVWMYQRWFVTRGQFWPSDIVVGCLWMSVCPFVCGCVCLWHDVCSDDLTMKDLCHTNTILQVCNCRCLDVQVMYHTVMSSRTSPGHKICEICVSVRVSTPCSSAR